MDAERIGAGLRAPGARAKVQGERSAQGRSRHPRVSCRRDACSALVTDRARAPAFCLVGTRARKATALCTVHLDVDASQPTLPSSLDRACLACLAMAGVAARFKATSSRVHLFNLSPAPGSQSTVRVTGPGL